jgi:hypothetical protein
MGGGAKAAIAVILTAGIAVVCGLIYQDAQTGTAENSFTEAQSDATVLSWDDSQYTGEDDSLHSEDVVESDVSSTPEDILALAHSVINSRLWMSREKEEEADLPEETLPVLHITLNPYAAYEPFSRTWGAGMTAILSLDRMGVSVGIYKPITATYKDSTITFGVAYTL